MAKFCGTCGAALNKQTGLCPVCGGAPVRGETPAEDAASRKAAPAASQRRSKFCGRCGSPTNPQTGFCPVCGAVTRYTPPEGSKNGGTSGSAEKHTKGKKRHTALWIVLAVAAVLLAAAAVLGVLVHFGVVDIPAVAQLEERLGLTPRAADAGSTGNTEDASDGTDGAVDSQPEEIRRVVQMNCYDANDVLRWYHTYTYDTDGEKSGGTSYDSQGNQTSHVDIGPGVDYWWYDDVGKLDGRRGTVVRESNTETVTYEDGDCEVTIYDANGNAIEMRRYSDGSDSPSNSWVNEYNTDDQLIKHSRYFSNGELWSYRFYEYDEEGRTIKSTYYDTDNPSLNGTSTYTYNEQGDMVRASEYDSTGTLRQYYTYEYAVVGMAS